MDEEFYNKISFLQRVQLKNDLPIDVFIKAVNHMPIHMHDGLELIYVIEGTIKIKVSFDYYELKAGDFLLINVFEVHEIEKISDQNLILFLQLEKGVLGREVRLFAFHPFFYRNCNEVQVELIKKIMVQIYICHEKSDYKNEIITAMNEIVMICMNYFQMQHFDPINKSESPFKSNTVKLERIGNTYRYFYGAFNNKIQLNEIAKREFIDKYYVSHLIKTGTGSSFQENLNMVRLDRAEVLLLGTKIPIHEIVSAIGFSSYPYFNQQFKLSYGMTPLTYRKKYDKKTFPIIPMKFDLLSKNEEELKSILASRFQLQEEMISNSLLIKNVNKEKITKLLHEFGFVKESLESNSFELKRIILEFA